MARKLVLFLFLLAIFFGLVSLTFALEKVKLGSSVKVAVVFYLPILTAEEQGFWKENGLEVEWVPFGGGPPHMHALAAGAINIGLVANDLPMMAAERGLPVIMVADLVKQPRLLWVRTNSPYRHPRDLKGARVGVSALGGAEHSYGRIILAAHGLEKDVRFVGSGGIPQTMAGMKVGVFDAMVLAVGTVVGLKVEGIIREIASSDDHLPKPWVEHAVLARKDFARTKPELVRKILKATIQATDFVRKNPGWATNKIKGFQGISEEAAKIVYDNVQFTATGKLERKAVENVRRVLIEYGILTEKTPPVDDLFTNEYLSS